MKRFFLYITFLFLLLENFLFASEIIVKRKRLVVAEDQKIKLFASEKERFSPQLPQFSAKISSLWEIKPSNSFRLLNYQLKNGKTELYLSLAGGSITDNINRWRKQFQKNTLVHQEISSLPKRKEGFIVKLKGSYMGMRTKNLQKNYALLAYISLYEEGVLTVKMIGPIEEVQSHQKDFFQFIDTLKAL